MSPEDRRAAMLDAAEAVFLERGYTETTMTDVATAAGMSRKTLYGFYGSKDALFSAVISERTRVAVPQLTQEMLESPLEDVLVELVGQVTAYVLSPKQISMARLVISDAARSAALAAEFYWEGVHRGSASLSQLLAVKAAEGTIVIDDPVIAARSLAHMAFGDLQLAMLLGAHTPSPEEVSARVVTSVAIFLRGTTQSPVPHHDEESA